MSSIDHHIDLDPDQSRILVEFEAPSGENGRSCMEVFHALGESIPLMEIIRITTFLQDDGYIYSTYDEYHYKSTHSC